MNTGFSLVSGHPALDFTNTVTWGAFGPTRERLREYDDLARWAAAAGVLDSRASTTLLERATADAASAALALGEARAVRATLRGLFAPLVAAPAGDAIALPTFNTALSAAMQHLEIGPTGAGFGWHVRDDAMLGTIAAQVVWTAAQLLTSGDLERLRTCQHEPCGHLFIDTSRNGRRRWCSMNECGSRAKARRYYQRKREADPRRGMAAGGDRVHGDATGSP